MAPKNRLTPDRQKLVLRLSASQPDEARLLADYEKRSDRLGRPDSEYLRRLALVGHALLSRIHPDLSGTAAEAVALSTNESNNTGKEPLEPSSPNESKADLVALGQVGEPKPEEVVGLAIRQLAGVLKGNTATS